MKKMIRCGILLVLLVVLCFYGYKTTFQQKEIQTVTMDANHVEEENTSLKKNVIQQRRDAILQDIITEDMSDYEKVKAIHDYIVTVSSYEKPIGLDAWILYGEKEQIEPTFLEKRASSILLYGFGYCEDYAAAIAVLLDGVKIPVRYLAGLGYARGRFMDHAWNLVEIDGVWYHLDATFDDSWSQHGSIQYNYFLKSDQSMLATHRFKENLLAMNVLSEEEAESIHKEFMGEEVCPSDYPATPSIPYTATRLDKEEIQYQLQQDRLLYEETYGIIDPQRYDATPPVFGNEGFNRP